MNVSATPSNAALPKWTVLVYSAADNNLKSYMLDDIREIEAVPADSYTNIVAQVDEGGTVGASRYLLQKGGTTEGASITAPPLEKLGDVDMADPNMLGDFINWGITNYPAENYMLIISDHGGGWPGAISDDSRGTWASTPMLKQGLARGAELSGVHLNVLGFDACQMAAGEVMHELAPYADFIVASQQNEGADGWQYTKLLNPNLINNMRTAHMMKINVDARELAIMAVTSAATNQSVLPTMAAVETAKIPAFTAAVDQLGKAILATETPNATLSQIRNSSQSFGSYKDAGDFTNRVATSDKVQDQALKDAAAAVRDSVSGPNGAVIAEEHSDRYPGAHGLHIDISAYGTPNGYEDLQFAKDTSWPAALEKMSK